MRSVNDEKFEYSYLGVFFPWFGFFVGSKTRHQLQHEPLPDNNRFGNRIERVFGPSRPDKSSSSLYL